MYLRSRIAYAGGIALAAAGLWMAWLPPRAADAGPAPSQPTARVNVLDGTLGDPDRSPELSTAELQAALRDPAVVVLDARPMAEYAVSQIPGARSVPGKPNMAASAYTADVSAVMKMIPERSRSEEQPSE